MHSYGVSSSRRTASDANDARLIFMATFMVFLIVVAVTRCLPRSWRPIAPGLAGRQSIIGEARSAANMCVPFAFMG